MIRGARNPLLLAAGCVGAFFVLLALAYGAGFARWADGAALQGFIGLQRPYTVPVFERIAHLLDPLPYALLSLCVVSAGLARGRVRQALAAGALLGGSAMSSQLLKPALAAERHHEFLGLAQINDAAYPSGHATASMALALAAVLVAPPAWRGLIAIAGGAFALAVSFSLLALGWHFPSDVVGGYLVATTWCLVAVAGVRLAAARWPERDEREPARLSIEPRHARAAIGSLAIAAATTFALLLPQLTAYAERHTAATAVALATLAAAAALLATVTQETLRR